MTTPTALYCATQSSSTSPGNVGIPKMTKSRIGHCFATIQSHDTSDSHKPLTELCKLDQNFWFSGALFRWEHKAKKGGKEQESKTTYTCTTIADKQRQQCDRTRAQSMTGCDRPHKTLIWLLSGKFASKLRFLVPINERFSKHGAADVKWRCVNSLITRYTQSKSRTNLHSILTL